jgi:HEAT repeat protein
MVLKKSGRKQNWTKSDAVAKLNARSQREAFEAAKLLYSTADKRLQETLISVLRNGRRPFNRAAAAYVMQVVTTQKVVTALERCLSDIDESPRVRGEAAEALTHNHRKKSHNVLLRNLMDPSKEVRFWCAFALGQMAERRAVPTLTKLAATDARTVKGFHSVSTEAKDAIRNIEVENNSHRRKAGCVFCMSR